MDENAYYGLCTSRKGRRIDTPVYKYSQNLILVLLLLSFLYAVNYEGAALMRYSVLIFGETSGVLITKTSFYLIYAFYALIELVLLELFLSFYYIVGSQTLGELAPFSSREFKFNIRPFFILRNLIWGTLALSAHFFGGATVGLTVTCFELASTLVCVALAYNYFVKYFVAKGHEARLLLSFFLPYLIIQTASIVALFV